jgi:hypothetical protein
MSWGSGIHGAKSTGSRIRIRNTRTTGSFTIFVQVSMGQEPRESEILQSLLFTLYLSLFSTVTSTYTYPRLVTNSRVPNLVFAPSGSIDPFWTVFRIRRIYKFLCLPDQGAGSGSVSREVRIRIRILLLSSKNSKKPLFLLFCFVTSL